MTNADKYLRIGETDYKEFVCGLRDYLDSHKDNYDTSNLIMNYLNKPCKPTLKEDERVILKNLNEQIWEKIGRNEYGQLSLKTRTKDDDENFFNCCYGHLFQFIKERRRIQHKRIVGGEMKSEDENKRL